MELVKKDGSTLEIYLEDLGGEGEKEDVQIAMLQTSADDFPIRDCIYLTPDMVDDVCKELQYWKSTFENEKGNADEKKRLERDSGKKGF